MPTGKYTLDDIAPAPTGKYTAADIATGPNMAMTPADLGISNPIPMSQAVPTALRGKPTMADRIKAGTASPLPGSFEGKPENIGQYIPSGPGQVARGIGNIAIGNVARGGHQLIAGAGETMMPVAPLAITAAPVAAAAGVGGGLIGSTAAQRGATALGATPEQATFAGDVGGLIGGVAAPKIAALGQGALSRGLLLGKTPEGAYESALKPSTVIPGPERQAMVATGLRERIPVSKGGTERITDLLDRVNSEIGQTIQTNPDAPISRGAVLSKLPAVKAGFRQQVAPTADLKAIDAVGDDFTASHPPVIRAEDAQAIKQGTYARLGSRAYGEVGTATTEAEKALARGLKDEIAAQFPEISSLNARDSALLDLQPVLERAVGRVGNHQLLGIGTPIVTGAAKAVTGSNKLAVAAGVLKGVLDNPNIKSRLAISLVKAGVNPSAAQARIASYVGALTQQSARGLIPSPSE